MAKRNKVIQNILNTIGLPEIQEGMRQAGKYGESWVPETQNFRGGPAPYAAFQGKRLKPDLTDTQAEDVLGYGGSFGERQLQRDTAGAVQRDAQGQALKTSGNYPSAYSLHRQLNDGVSRSIMYHALINGDGIYRSPNGKSYRYSIRPRPKSLLDKAFD
ncbi:hypothetical protein OAK65_03810 [Synechococcus sp. AH-551-N17]|nr:hypothetical protein [Synechococcus sp. AH-551-N17]